MSHDLGVDIPRDQMLTVREVAKLLRLTPQHVRLMAQRGDIPRHKIGEGANGRVLFAPRDVEDYIRANREAR